MAARAVPARIGCQVVNGQEQRTEDITMTAKECLLEAIERHPLDLVARTEWLRERMDEAIGSASTDSTDWAAWSVAYWMTRNGVGRRAN